MPILRGLCAVSIGILLTIQAVSCRQAVEPAPASQTDGVTPETPKAARGSNQPTTETWDAVLIGGTQVGSVHTTTTPRGDAEHPLVSIVSDTQLAIARFGDVARMRVVTESIETEDGVVRSFSHRTESGAFPIVVEGRVETGPRRVDHAHGRQGTNQRIPLERRPRWFLCRGGIGASHVPCNRERNGR